MARTVSFTQMKDGTREDYELLHQLEGPYLAGTADRLLRELKSQGDETLAGYKITRLDHALQSATRARRDGADTDWVVAALLHDIGDGLAPQNHDRFAAEILRPFLRDEATWVVELLPVLCRFLRAVGPGELRSRLSGGPAGELRGRGQGGLRPQGL